LSKKRGSGRPNRTPLDQIYYIVPKKLLEILRGNGFCLELDGMNGMEDTDDLHAPPANNKKKVPIHSSFFHPQHNI
jgi:hypothetical protein